jgi:hypothetical protein
MLVLGENSDVEAMRQLVMVSDAAPAGDDSDKEVQT